MDVEDREHAADVRAVLAAMIIRGDYITKTQAIGAAREVADHMQVARQEAWRTQRKAGG